MIKSLIMNYLEENKYKELFSEIGKIAVTIGYECYVIGGYVRDLLLGKDNDDIDFVVVGNGLEMAKAVGNHFKSSKVSLYESYGTAKVDVNGIELEFVGARKEFYHRESRNPIVEDGTLSDDMARRDFTINDMALSLMPDSFGELIDPYNGLDDLMNHVIRCVSDPNERFDEDPLRMLRCIRFASRFGFMIDPETYNAIKDNYLRINIITRERVLEELNKMIMANEPSFAFMLLKDTKLLDVILPEIARLDCTEPRGPKQRTHKNIFQHTLQVLDKVAEKSDDLYLRWATLFHDVGKFDTRKYTESDGWSFKNHELVGARQVEHIAKRIGLPLDARLDFMKKMISMHMRPMNLCDEGVTDSAIRRLLFDAGDDIDSLMILCDSDITSSYEEKRQRFHENYELLKKRMIEVEEKDHIRNFQPALDGNDIMRIFNLRPSREVGEIKKAIKDAILDGKVSNNKEDCLNYVKGLIDNKLINL